MTNTTKSLRKDVTAARGVTPRSIVRFDRTLPLRDEMRAQERTETVITYAAIFVAGAWYLTGLGRMATRSYTHR